MAAIIKEKKLFTREEFETFCTRFQETMSHPALREDQISTLFKRTEAFRFAEWERSKETLEERSKTCSYCNSGNSLSFKDRKIAWSLTPCCALADYCSNACKLNDRQFHRVVCKWKPSY